MRRQRTDREAPPASPPPRDRSDGVLPALLVALVVVFLLPCLLPGRSMLPLDLIPLFQPWAGSARELWGEIPAAHNPLLDALQQYYPRRVYMSEALTAGWLPLWNPFVYTGSPFLAAQQGAVLYPPAWLLALFAPERQFGWSALLHLSAAALGTYAYLRQVGLRPAGAFTGGAAFALNGYMVVWLAYPNVTQWTLAWLPAVLFFWERGLDRDDLRWTGLSAAALALCVLGGHGQSSAYVLLVWGAWALLRVFGSPAPLRSLARHVALPGVLALGLSLGHILPALEFLPRTDRGGRVPWPSVVGASMPISQLWTLLLPRLFGDGTESFAQAFWMPAGAKAQLAFVERSFYPGAAVLVLAAGAWTAVRYESRVRFLALFAAAAAVLAVLMALGTWLYWPLWRLAQGFGNFTAPARIVCLAGWGLACLAAIGVHALTDLSAHARWTALRWIAASTAGLSLLALAGHFVYGGAAPQEVAAFLERAGLPGVDSLAGRDFGLALAFLAVPATLAWASAAGRLRPQAAGIAAGLVVAADLFAFGRGFNPAAHTKYLHRETPELTFLAAQTKAARESGDLFRFLSVGPAGQELNIRLRMPSNLPSTVGLADALGSDSFVTRRYREWEEAMAAANGGSAWSKPGAIALRSAAVRYYLTGRPDTVKGLATPALPLASHKLLQDTGALPYARLHTHAQALPRSELLRTLGLPNRVPIIALTSGDRAAVYEGPIQVTPFQAFRPNGNRLLLAGEGSEPGLLVIAEQYDSAWRARVNGRPSRVVPADHLLIGVPLPAGPARVDLIYAPASFRVGLFGALLSLAGLAALLLSGPRRNSGGAAGS